MSVFSPRFTGKVEIASPAPVFFEAMKARAQLGLLTGRAHRRARYVVTGHTERELTIRACDFITAINVGLNEVVLRAADDRSVEYSVSYLRWAGYVVGLGAVLGLAFIVGFAFLGIESQLSRYALVTDPASNRTIGLALFWALTLFWAAIWPWLLIMMHKPVARKLLDRIIREVDIAARPPIAPEGRQPPSAPVAAP
jgi:hypothetical protein